MSPTLPKLYRSIAKMQREEQEKTDTTRDVVRKAQLRPSAVASNYVDIWGTFSRISAANGYALTLAAGAHPFPDGTASMSRYADMRGSFEARLLVTVVEAAPAGCTLSVESDVLPTAPSVDLDVDDLVWSEWQPISAQGAALMEWVVSSPSSGSAVIGLCQLQVR